MKIEHLEAMNKLKSELRLPLSEFDHQFLELESFEFIANKSAWEREIECDIALPSKHKTKFKQNMLVR
jgi:hypothetical protein